MNSPLSRDRNMLTTRSYGAMLHRTCTIYGGEKLFMGRKLWVEFSPAQQGRECDPRKAGGARTRTSCHRSSVMLESHPYSAGIAGLAIA
jgi:hypothetical protein